MKLLLVPILNDQQRDSIYLEKIIKKINEINVKHIVISSDGYNDVVPFCMKLGYRIEGLNMYAFLPDESDYPPLIVISQPEKDSYIRNAKIKSIIQYRYGGSNHSVKLLSNNDVSFGPDDYPLIITNQRVNGTYCGIEIQQCDINKNMTNGYLIALFSTTNKRDDKLISIPAESEMYLINMTDECNVEHLNIHEQELENREQMIRSITNETLASLKNNESKRTS
jgi:hypothetical protein